MRMLSSVRPVSRANNWPDGIIPYDADRYAQLTLEIMHLLPSLTGVLCLSPSMKGRTLRNAPSRSQRDSSMVICPSRIPSSMSLWKAK